MAEATTTDTFLPETTAARRPPKVYLGILTRRDTGN
jgi:hypothetical protein